VEWNKAHSRDPYFAELDRSDDLQHIETTRHACHVVTMSRKPAKGEYIETVSSVLMPLYPPSIHPQFYQSPVPNK
jgi:hypothetical protein